MGTVLIVEENSAVPFDRRVWYEATTLRDAGWRVIVICPYILDSTGDPGHVAALPEPALIEDLEGIMVYRFPLFAAENGAWSYLREYITAFIAITRLSWRVWRKERFDILHVCNPPDIFFPIGIFYRLLGARFVFDHHDLFPEMVKWRYRGLSGRLMYAVARAAEYLTLRGANAVIATNLSYRQNSIERGHVPESRVIVVRNGPKIAEFVPIEPMPELKCGFPFLVCFVGMMAEEDGIAPMVETIRQIVHDCGRRDIRFLLIGDGPSRAKALAQIARWGLDPFVDMPGRIDDDRLLRRYMSTADLFVSPEPLTPMNVRSTFVKIGEYMAIGKPIVAYDLKETRYTAEDTASYVANGDTRAFAQAILDLLDDPPRRHEMGKRGRQRVLSTLGWEHQSQHLLRAYAVAQEQTSPAADVEDSGKQPVSE